jgi:hypothetical protein
MPPKINPQQMKQMQQQMQSSSGPLGAPPGGKSEIIKNHIKAIRSNTDNYNYIKIQYNLGNIEKIDEDHKKIIDNDLTDIVSSKIWSNEPSIDTVAGNLSKAINEIIQNYICIKLNSICEDVISNIDNDDVFILTPNNSANIFMYILNKYLFIIDAIVYNNETNQNTSPVLLTDILKESINPLLDNLFEKMMSNFNNSSILFGGADDDDDEEDLKSILGDTNSLEDILGSNFGKYEKFITPDNLNEIKSISDKNIELSEEQLKENIINKIQLNIYEKLLSEDNNNFISKIQGFYINIFISKIKKIIKNVTNNSEFKNQIKELILKPENQLKILQIIKIREESRRDEKTLYQKLKETMGFKNTEKEKRLEENQKNKEKQEINSDIEYAEKQIHTGAGFGNLASKLSENVKQTSELLNKSINDKTKSANNFIEKKGNKFAEIGTKISNFGKSLDLQQDNNDNNNNNNQNTPFIEILHVRLKNIMDSMPYMAKHIQRKYVVFLNAIFDLYFPAGCIDKYIKNYILNLFNSLIAKEIIITKENSKLGECSLPDTDNNDITGGSLFTSHDDYKYPKHFLKDIEVEYCNKIYLKKDEIIENYKNFTHRRGYNIITDHEKKFINEINEKKENSQNNEKLQRIVYKYRFAFERIFREKREEDAKNEEIKIKIKTKKRGGTKKRLNTGRKTRKMRT